MMTDDTILNAIVGVLAALIGALVVVVGWWIVHRNELRRDQLAKRRDLRVKYLIDAYRSLENASNRPMSPPNASEIESAMADIQLFGSQEQVATAQEFVCQFAANGSGSLDDMLADLRRDLRKELALDAVPHDIKYLRFRSLICSPRPGEHRRYAARSSRFCQ